MGTTKVSLKPLHKITQLRKLLHDGKCISVENTGNGMFTLTFQIDTQDNDELLQDLALIFDNGKPQAFISLPYHWNNANEG